MNQDQDTQPPKKVFAVADEKLKEFHPKCLAVANAGSEIFLLLGDPRIEGLQPFKVVRTYNSGSIGKIVEPVKDFDAVWRCPALMRFKAILDMRPGGYANIGFLRSEVAEYANRPRFLTC